MTLAFWKKWDAEDGARWDRIKAKGKWRFILRTAALNAFLWAVVFSLITYIQLSNEIRPRPSISHFLYRYVPINLAIGLILGIFSAALFWMGAQRNYRKLKTTK